MPDTNFVSDTPFENDISESYPANSDRFTNVQEFLSSFRNSSDEERITMIPYLKTLGRQHRSEYLLHCVPTILHVLKQCFSSLQISIAETLLSEGLDDLSIDLSKELCTIAMQIMVCTLDKSLVGAADLSSSTLSQLMELYSYILFMNIPKTEWNRHDLISMVKFYDHICAPVKSAKAYEIRDAKIKAATNLLCGITTLEMAPTFFALEISTRVLTLFLAVQKVQWQLSGFVCQQFAHALSTMAEAGRPQSYLNERVWREIVWIWTPSIQQPNRGEVDQTSNGSGREKGLSSGSLGNTLERGFKNIPKRHVDERVHTAVLQNALEAAIVLSRFAMREGKESQYALMLGRSVVDFVLEKNEGANSQQGPSSDLLLKISEHISTILSLFSSEEEDSSYLQVLQILSSSANPHIRTNCATHLPSVAVNVFHPSKRIRQRRMRTLISVIRRMAFDSEVQVRVALANVFHNSVGYLVGERKREICDIANGFLTDESSEVRHAFISKLHVTLDALSEVCDSPILNLRVLYSDDYDTPEGLVRAETVSNEIGLAAHFLTFQEKHRMVELLSRLLGSQRAAVRNAAGTAFLKLIRATPDIPNQKKLISDFCFKAGINGQKRQLPLVDILANACQVFSARFYCELFAPHLFALAADDSAYVRLKVAETLHRVVIACKRLPKFADVVDALKSDSSQPVQSEMTDFPARASLMLSQDKSSSVDDSARLRQELQDYKLVVDSKPLPSHTISFQGLKSEMNLGYSWRGRRVRSTIFANRQGDRLPRKIARSFASERFEGRRAEEGFSFPGHKRTSSATTQSSRSTSTSTGSWSGRSFSSLSLTNWRTRCEERHISKHFSPSRVFDDKVIEPVGEKKGQARQANSGRLSNHESKRIYKRSVSWTEGREVRT